MGDIDVPASNSNINSGLSELEQYEQQLEHKEKTNDGTEATEASEDDFSGELC